MARTDTLKNFLTDVATAIRTKGSTSELIKASNFDTAISNLPSGSSYKPEFISFTGYSGTSLTEALKCDTSNITSLKNCFGSCYNLTSIDIHSWNTSNVTDTDSMFSQCNALASLNITNLDLQKLTSCSQMFYGCKKLTSIDLSTIQFNSSANIYSPSMFSSCSKLQTITFPSTGLKLSGSNIFYYNDTLTTINNLDKINFNATASVESMFYECKALTSIDLSGFTLGQTYDLSNMFYNCTSLTSVNLCNFNSVYGYAARSTNMFAKCTSLTHIDIRSWNLSRISSSYKNNMFGADATTGVPDDCEIIVMDQTCKDWINTNFTRLTNVVIAS